MDYIRILLYSICLTSFLNCKRESQFNDDLISEEIQKNTDSTSISTKTWNFTNQADHTANSSHINFSNSGASLQQVDHVFNEGDLALGTLNGVKLNLSNLELDTGSPANISFNTDWTPFFSNLVAYWTFDTDYIDSSSNNFVGTALTSPSLKTTSPQIGTGYLHFDQSQDGLDLLNAKSIINNSKGTVSIWLKREFNTGGNGRNVFSYEKGSSDKINFSFQKTAAGEKIAFNYKAAGNSQTCTSTKTWQVLTSYGSWSHFVITWDTSSTHVLYLNGKKLCEMTNAVSFDGTATLLRLSKPSGAIGFIGGLDELGIWDIPLTQESIVKIYKWQKYKYSGSYQSPIMDMGGSTTWSSITPKTTLPYGKQLNISTLESSGDYSELNADFTDGLRLNMSFDEISTGTASGGEDFSDTSSNSFHGTIVNTGELGADGITGKSFLFNGSDTSITLPSSSSILAGDTSFTLSTWFKNGLLYDTSSSDGVLVGARLMTIHKGSGSPASKVFIGFLGDNTDNITTFYSDGTANTLTVSNVGMNDGHWHHLLSTYDAVTNLLVMYYDGKVVASVNAGTIDSSGTDSAKLGSYISTKGFYKGYLDEANIWNRALTATEVKELYQRHANKISYQIKSCVDSNCQCKSFNTSPVGTTTDCDGDGVLNSVDSSDIYKADFIGPGGSETTAYSELNNRSVGDNTFNCTDNTYDSDSNCIDYEIITAAESLNTPPVFTYANMATSAPITNNQYFQYKAILSSLNNSACTGNSLCSPELTEVKVDNGNRYASKASITTNSGFSFSDITEMTFSSSGTCTIKYQLSPNGTNYYYLSGSTWTLAPSADDSYASLSADISSNITTFKSVAGTGTLYLKAFMISDGTQNCLLSSVTFK